MRLVRQSQENKDDKEMQQNERNNFFYFEQNGNWGGFWVWDATKLKQRF
jgi:hypothetical protein